MKTLTAGIISASALVVGVVGGYFVFRDSIQQTQDKLTIRNGVHSAWRTTTKYVNEVFATSKQSPESV